MEEAADLSRKFPAFKRVKNGDAGSTEDVHYYLFYDGVPNQIQTSAEKELKETAENSAKGMRRLQKFVEDQKIPDADENTLRVVLRSCKYDIKKSETKLEKFLKVRRMMIQRLVEMDSEVVVNIVADQCFGFLPYRDKHGRAIFYTKITENTQQYDTGDLCTCVFSMMLYVLTLPMTSLTGIAYIGDCLTPSFSVEVAIAREFKNNIYNWFSFPIRERKVDFINVNFIIRWFYNLIRPVLPWKLKARINFHDSNLQSLQKFYHPDILPEEFGGNMGPLNTKFYRKEFLNFVKKLKAEHQENIIAAS